MKISTITASELDGALYRRWSEIQRQSGALAGPFFSVDFFQAVAAVRNDVFVAVIEQDGGVHAFFPFQRKTSAVAGPVGGRLSDYQGIIAPDGFMVDAEALLSACRLKIWDFDHLIDQEPFRCYARNLGDSPVINLSGGFKAYQEERRQYGTKRLVKLQRGMRKLGREAGEVRFELDSRDRRAFSELVKWKSTQCRRTGVPDFMSWSWTVELLERIWATQSAGFSGMLSVLWRDEDIVAVHFGMRASSVFHYWFPAYNHRFGSYTPGGILLLKLIEALSTSGVTLIDLGKGEDSYKRAFANGAVPLMEGSVMLPSFAAVLRHRRMMTQRFLRSSPFFFPLRAARGRLRMLNWPPR